MADPSLTRALDPAKAQRLLAAACDNIRGLENNACVLENELLQSRVEARQLNATLDSSPLVALSKLITRLRIKVLPPGSGPHSFVRWVIGRSRRLRMPPYPDPYPVWIARHEPQAFAQLQAPSNAAPCIYFLLTGHGSALQASLKSVLAQTDPNWRLLLTVAAPYPFEDARIQTVEAPAHASAAAVWNKALESAPDGYVAILRPGDHLAPGAVSALRGTLEKEPRIGMIYSDEDAIDGVGRRCDPLFKPDWSPETFRAMDYMGNLTAFHLPLVREIGGFRPEFGEAAVYDLALRASEKTASIRHSPLVLYHSQKASVRQRGYGLDGSRAVQEHLDRLQLAGEVAAESTQGLRQIRYRVGLPLVSIVIPSKDQPRLLERCVESLLAGDYPSQEIVLVDTGSVTPEAREVNARLALRPGVRLLHWDQPFNYSAVNNFAVRQARGDVLTFLNDDTEVISPDWLERMLEYALQPNVGAVGAKLLYSNETIQHAGIVLGLKNIICGHLLQRAPDSAAAGHPLAVARNVSAVTGACLMMRRSVFDEVGGFEEQFAGDFNDVDLCLKVRQSGYQVIWTPHARLFHHECQTRGKISIVNGTRHTLFVLERLLFLDRWGAVVGRGDPFYNPNLNQDEADGTVRR
ncbi:MAG TPA: glycosyl transferase family 2 [Planctomycetales bacterium]|jgi:GT2 family glycosyltransferase|nr:glycosyl transferase family 2 [Planctomycetales bacterium]